MAIDIRMDLASMPQMRTDLSEFCAADVADGAVGAE